MNEKLAPVDSFKNYKTAKIKSMVKYPLTEYSKYALTMFDETMLRVRVANLNFRESNLVCDDLPQLPVAYETMFGELFRGKIPIVCGVFTPYVEGEAISHYFDRLIGTLFSHLSIYWRRYTILL